jgi:hypothetical protein
VGAGTGAIAGAIATDSVTGTVVGGLLGALVGGAIGHYAYDRERSRDETIARYDQGGQYESILRIEEASAWPETVRPGDSVDLRMTYAVITPSGNSITRITESREIWSGSELVGNPEVRVERADGTYSSNVPLRLPGNARPGTYSVKYTVQSDFAVDVRETTFNVR